MPSSVHRIAKMPPFTVRDDAGIAPCKQCGRRRKPRKLNLKKGYIKMAFNSADIGAFKNVWVFCEQRQGVMMPTSFELISEGRKLADELGAELCGLQIGRAHV